MQITDPGLVKFESKEDEDVLNASASLDDSVGSGAASFLHDSESKLDMALEDSVVLADEFSATKVSAVLRSGAGVG